MHSSFFLYTGLVLTGWSQVTMAISIQKCHLPSGETLFTDRICPPLSARETLSDLKPLITLPALTKQEWGQAQRLRAIELERTEKRATSRRQTAAARQSQHAERQSKCAQARLSLKEIRVRRRQGYDARLGQELTQRETSQRLSVRENC